MSYLNCALEFGTKNGCSPLVGKVNGKSFIFDGETYKFGPNTRIIGGVAWTRVIIPGSSALCGFMRENNGDIRDVISIIGGYLVEEEDWIDFVTNPRWNS